MGNLFSTDSSEGRPSTQRGIHGNFSGNTGPGNQFGFGNTATHNYYGSADSSDKQPEVLRCLYKSAYESHRRRVREPVEGTCTWVTEHPKYREWVGRRAGGLLWLSADPGCGKSVMASFLIDHLKIETDAIVCYFFFKDDSEEQKNATFALCAILHQLFSQRNSLCIYAEGALKGKGERFTEEVDTLWDILVGAVADRECGEVICVVDALDECENVTLAPLIHHLKRLPGLQTSNTPLKFLVTSRPYHNIEKELGARETTIRLRGEDEVSAITTDVTRVIDNGITELERIWRSPGGLKYLHDLLLSSADRTFLWVALVLEILKDSEVGSREEFTRIISAAPHDLAEFYSKILNKSSDPNKARRILHIVVATARPLTVMEMNVAFAITRDHKSVREISRHLYHSFEKTMKSLCGHFVRVIDSKICLVHQTAREFLIKGSLPGQGNWQYTLCHKDSNFIVADICISYLLGEEFAGAPLAVDGFGRVSREEVEGYLRKYIFLDYAARHWADHLRDSQDHAMELFEYTRMICEAGPKHCLTWFQVYWFKNWRWDRFPKDFTHLMIASFFGLGMAVDRLLGEAGDINARSEIYGTALNVAAARKDEGVARKLLQKNVKAYISGREYNILQTKISELERLEFELKYEAEYPYSEEIIFELQRREEKRERKRQDLRDMRAIVRSRKLLKLLLMPPTPDPPQFRLP